MPKYTIVEASKAGYGQRVLNATIFFLIYQFMVIGVGAFAGWLIGMTTMGDWVVTGATPFGLHLERTNLWQTAAFLAWVSTYFKVLTSNGITIQEEK